MAKKLQEHPAWKRLVAGGKCHLLGFDASSNRRFAALVPDIPLQQLAGTVPEEQTLADWSTFADSMGTNYRTLTAEGAGRVHAGGLGSTPRTHPKPSPPL